MSLSKRVMDLIIAVPVLVLTLPFMIVIGLVIRLDSPGPALFRQERLGLNGKSFTVLKFRTMVNRKRIDQDREEIVQAGTDSRITRVGRFLRKTSLDELPQLVNVVRGEMSVVGPRPVIPEQVKAIPQEYMKRFTVPPGITGLAQVRGRRSLNWLQQLKYDVEYVENQRLLGDIKLLIQTVRVVVTGEGVYGTQEDNWRNYIGRGA